MKKFVKPTTLIPLKKRVQSDLKLPNDESKLDRDGKKLKFSEYPGEFDSADHSENYNFLCP